MGRGLVERRARKCRIVRGLEEEKEEGKEEEEFKDGWKRQD